MFNLCKKHIKIINLQVFKQKGVSINLGRGFIYTPKDTWCGVNLNLGEKYIISGAYIFN